MAIFSTCVYYYNCSWVLSFAECVYILVYRTFTVLTSNCDNVKCFSDNSPLKNWVASTLRISVALSAESSYSFVSVIQFGIYIYIHTQPVELWIKGRQWHVKYSEITSEPINLFLDNKSILNSFDQMYANYPWCM